MKKYLPVSVVIPIFNSSKTIIRCLESVNNQRGLPSEVIIIDDFSNDNSIIIVNDYINNHKLLNIILLKNNTNKGPSFSRNIGILKSKFEYIAFLDSDDTWHEEKLNIQYNFMKKNKNILLTGHDHINYSNINSFKNLRRIHNKYIYIKFQSLLLKNPFITPSIMIRKNLGVLFDEKIKYMEDFKFILESSQKTAIVKIHNNLAYIFKHPYASSGLSSNFIKMFLCEFKVLYFFYQKISLTYFIFLNLYYLSKFLRRLLIIFAYKIRT